MSAPAGGDKKNIVKMAYIYFQEGRWDKAIEEYKKLVALDPEDINTHNMLGDVYVKKGSTREAFEEYIKVSNDFSSRGQADKAVIVNKKIAALDSSLLPAEAQKKQNLIKQTIKAETAMEQGDVDAAIEALSEVLKLDNENLAAFSKLGELLEKKGMVDEACKQYVMLGGAFLKNRLFKKAQEMFQKVVTLEPENIDARVNLAQIFIKQGSEGDAKKEYLVVAELALNKGDLENANAYASKAVEFKSIEAHYILGMVLFKKQKISEAKAEFESLLRFKVNHVGALTYLGKCLLEMNQADKAAENIQKALKVEKDNLVAIEAAVELSLKMGKKPEAITHLNTLVDRYIEKKDPAKALEFARNLVSLDDNNMTAQTKLAELLKQTGDNHGAADAYFKAALAAEKANKKDQAADLVRKTLELNPGHTEAQKRLMGDVVAGATPAPAPVAAPQASAPAAPKTAESIGKIPPSGVLDLEEESVKPTPTAPKPTPAPALVAEKPKPAEPEPGDELKEQMTLADDYVKQGLVQEAIEIYQQLLETHPGNAEVKQKLNQAYTAYIKTGEDVIGALEAEKKAKEEEEKHLRLEMEKKAQEEAKRLRAEMEMKARDEADKKAKSELEKRAREEAEHRVREEMEKRTQDEMLKKAREEAERKVKEEMLQKAKEEALSKAKDETERKVREEMERKAKEEAERKAREDAERKVQEERAAKKPAPADNAFATSRTEPPSKGETLSDENRDEFMTTAVAEIYTRQGLYEEAAKIYRRITQMEPDNLEARKKLIEVDNLIKSKTGKAPVAEPAPPPSKPAAPPTAPPAAPPHEPEKDSGGKKRPNRVGYV